ncbi:MAG: hypothetical protein ACJ796_04605 [Gemmatimonadaceae bacterium]
MGWSTINIGSAAIVRRLLLVLVVAGCVVLVARRLSKPTAVVHSSAGISDVRRDTSSGSARRKVLPVSGAFEGCPADGDGGDRGLNRLKNRIDSATWLPTPFASVLGFAWPRDVVRRMRGEWSWRDSIAVAHQEGLPVVVEGYFVASKQEGPEATNCHGAETRFRDWHLWLSEKPGKDRRRSIVVETTPVIRARHPEWSLSGVRRLVRDSTLVRVSGWLMLDPEHPEQLGKTRGTLWEIHPVMRIEVQRDGQWLPLQ